MEYLTLISNFLARIIADVLKDFLSRPDYTVDVAPAALEPEDLGVVPGVDDVLDKYAGVLDQD